LDNISTLLDDWTINKLIAPPRNMAFLCCGDAEIGYPIHTPFPSHPTPPHPKIPLIYSPSLNIYPPLVYFLQNIFCACSRQASFQGEGPSARSGKPKTQWYFLHNHNHPSSSTPSSPLHPNFSYSCRFTTFDHGAPPPPPSLPLPYSLS
jgi:hypothetical protein